MSDPQNPDANTPASPASSEPTPPAPPAYGEYAPTTPPAAPAPQQPAAPSYEQPAYAAPAYNAAPAYAGPPAQTAVPGKTMGIVAFILSFFFQLLALILGIVALVQSKKAGRGNGFAVAAIIISAVLMIIGTILFFAFFLPTINAATTCLNDPTATVSVWGVNVPCQQVLEQSGR